MSRSAGKKKPSDPSIADQLRQAIERSGLTYYAIGKQSGVADDLIRRFTTGERDMRLESAAKVAKALRLELKPIDGEGKP